MFYRQNTILGTFFIVAGLVGLFFAMGDLLFRIACGILALMIINHGMRLRGMPPLQFWGTSLFFNRWF